MLLPITQQTVIMVRPNGLSIRIRDGVNGPSMPEYKIEPGGNKRALEAVYGAKICPEITVHRDFEWHGTNGLYVSVQYGVPELQTLLWAPDPYGGEHTQDRKDWTIQIPGTQWYDPRTEDIINVEFFSRMSM